jgi:hypothetical protein
MPAERFLLVYTTQLEQETASLQTSLPAAAAPSHGGASRASGRAKVLRVVRVQDLDCSQGMRVRGVGLGDALCQGSRAEREARETCPDGSMPCEHTSTASPPPQEDLRAASPSHTGARTHAPTHTHRLAHTRIHTHIYTHTHTQVRTHTHARTHTHKHSGLHSHIHTNTLALPPPSQKTRTRTHVHPLPRHCIPWQRSPSHVPKPITTTPSPQEPQPPTPVAVRVLDEGEALHLAVRRALHKLNSQPGVTGASQDVGRAPRMSHNKQRQHVLRWCKQFNALTAGPRQDEAAAGPYRRHG